MLQQSSTHSAGIVHQLKVGLGSFLPPFRLEEVGGLAQVVVIQSCFEGRVCRLWKHTLLLQDGENPHGLERRQTEGGGSGISAAHVHVCALYAYCECECYPLQQVDAGLQVQAEVDEDPVDALLLVLFLLQHKHVVVEELLQLLIGEVDAQLLKAVVLEMTDRVGRMS